MLDSLKYTEMDEVQELQYHKEWVYNYACGLVEANGMPAITAYILADEQYDKYVENKAYTGRDNWIDAKRSNF